MRFVSTNDLVKGMKIARPIYNKNGVLLYERGTKLTKQGINSIKNFKLFGIYILEPVEPIPPMTEHDLEFERFQTMNVYGIRETWEMLVAGKKLTGIDKMALDIQKTYVTKEKKIDFTQTLRSEEDEDYKHALNVAILCALMSARLKISEREQLNLIKAALLYDVGEATECKIIADNDNIPADVREIIMGRYRLKMGVKKLKESIISVRLLQAAQVYDTLTAMKLGEEPLSDVAAVKKMLSEGEKYGMAILGALIDSIKILYPGICVELTNKRTGLVIKSNKLEALRPIVLLFDKNQVIDLSDDETYEEVQISDIMKKLDKRVNIDPELIEKYMKEYAG